MIFIYICIVFINNTILPVDFLSQRITYSSNNGMAILGIKLLIQIFSCDDILNDATSIKILFPYIYNIESKEI